MSREYDILHTIAAKKKWWIPLPLESYFEHDCINYWNDMIEWARLKRAYRARQKLKKLGRLTGSLNHPRWPRKPVRKF